MTKQDFEWLAKELARLLHLDMLTQTGYMELVSGLCAQYPRFNKALFMRAVDSYKTMWQTMETE